MQFMHCSFNVLTKPSIKADGLHFLLACFIVVMYRTRMVKSVLLCSHCSIAGPVYQVGPASFLHDGYNVEMCFLIQTGDFLVFF